MMNADLKLPVKCLKQDVFGKLINQPKNGVELETVIEMLKNIRGKGFSDRLHYMTPTFYFRRQLAQRFCVALSFVVKLLKQYRTT
ncbi:MAG: hypothetical protein ACRC8K_09800, partial [Waterburya sp.]